MQRRGAAPRAGERPPARRRAAVGRALHGRLVLQVRRRPPRRGEPAAACRAGARAAAARPRAAMVSDDATFRWRRGCGVTVRRPRRAHSLSMAGGGARALGVRNRARVLAEKNWLLSSAAPRPCRAGAPEPLACDSATARRGGPRRRGASEGAAARGRDADVAASAARPSSAAGGGKGRRVAVGRGPAAPPTAAGSMRSNLREHALRVDVAPSSRLAPPPALVALLIPEAPRRRPPPRRRPTRYRARRSAVAPLGQRGDRRRARGPRPRARRRAAAARRARSRRRRGRTTPSTWPAARQPQSRRRAPTAPRSGRRARVPGLSEGSHSRGRAAATRAVAADRGWRRVGVPSIIGSGRSRGRSSDEARASRPSSGAAPSAPSSSSASAAAPSAAVGPAASRSRGLVHPPAAGGFFLRSPLPALRTPRRARPPPLAPPRGLATGAASPPAGGLAATVRGRASVPTGRLVKRGDDLRETSGWEKASPVTTILRRAERHARFPGRHVVGPLRAGRRSRRARGRRAAEAGLGAEPVVVPRWLPSEPPKLASRCG